VFLSQDGRGFGLRVGEDVEEGTLLCEYTGEVITKEEGLDRMRTKSFRKGSGDASGDGDVYYAAMTADLLLDAQFQGGVARFANHSCAPNCQMQKWSVRGETRVVLAAGRDLFAGEEITYNYQMDTLGGSLHRQVRGVHKHGERKRRKRRRKRRKQAPTKLCTNPH
jgi:histone-lysine N-methyltransferase NSD2